MNRTGKDFGSQDYPEHRRRLEEQAANLGMEACKTHEERADYVRRLVRGIFKSDLPDVRVIAGTKLVYGEAGLNPIPEFERVIGTWRDFPSTELARIIEEERAVAAGEHLKLVDDESPTSNVA